MMLFLALLFTTQAFGGWYEEGSVEFKPGLYKLPPPPQDLPLLLTLHERALPAGTCNSDTPCENAACCGGNNNNLCGYSPGECGAANNCDAKAECGIYGKAGQQNCPLKVCCSKFGFCGSTDALSASGCQSGFGGCANVKRPGCSGNSIAKRTIGYYESWAATRKCQSVLPEDLNLNGFTHVNFAFACFDPSSFQIAPVDSNSGTLLGRFTALKDTHSGLQTWISVGGWSFTDPGPTGSAFSDMTSSAGNRQKFISGLISFIDHYGFDGVDLDWEYPQADDRGGLTADKANYVSFVKELKAAFVMGNRYGISMTLPTSYWYLQHFDVAAMQPSVDWFNFMTYDLHGVWDAQSKALGPHIAPHTNITEIDMGLDLLWRAGIEPSKAVLGLGWYGRSFTLVDSACNTPNGVCQFSVGAKAGPCSDASGILTLQEIKDVISDNHLQPMWDKQAAVKGIMWDSNQWVSYDDDDTFDQKRKLANSRCLGGTMVWAMDQVDQKADNGLAPAPGVTTHDQEERSDDLQAGVTCYATDCDQKCKSGTNEVAQMNGQPGKLSTNDRCKAGKYRRLCCDNGTRMGQCQWRGYRGVGLTCMGGCDEGETEVVQNTNSHDKKTGDRTCTGGIQSYCCKGFKPAPSASDLKGKAEDAVKDAAKDAAEQAALDIAANAFCRIAVPALLAPLEAIEAAIPIIGEIADIAEIAATPALIQLCVKGAEKEGKAVFKVFGKKHTLTVDKPSATRRSRPPESSHSILNIMLTEFVTVQSPAKTSPSACPRSGGKRADCEPDNRVHTTEITAIIVHFQGAPTAIVCDGNPNALPNSHPQACLNYHSIIQHYPQFATLTCSYIPPRIKGLPVSDSWVMQRDLPRFIGVMEEKRCSPDEYPPAAICDFNDGWENCSNRKALALAARPQAGRGQRIRLLESKDNQNAGTLFGRCPRVADYTTDNHATRITRGPGRRAFDTVVHQYRAVYNRRRYTMDFVNLQNLPDDGFEANPCQPVIDGTSRAGFALLNEDQWFIHHEDEAEMTNSWRRPRLRHRAKRQDDWVDELGCLIVADANSTRLATPEELKAWFGFDKCGDDTCSRELEALRAVVTTMREHAHPTAPIAVEASATLAPVDDELAPPRSPGSNVAEPVLPQRTGEAARDRRNSS
ncbi:glycoside hydrolase family 18 protein [Apiospora saccharicola]|uniref:chitinase n=1 Tax=Apiospora saccharicola TaxID=335842 RepID=A0ABR1WH23_9PEZI